MPVSPPPDPGLPVVHWPEDVAACRVVAGEAAPKEAKRQVMHLLSSDQGPVRVFMLLEMFHQLGEQTRIIPDDFAPALDLILREQLAGKGVQLKRRGPPKEKPAEFFERVRVERERKEQQDGQGQIPTTTPDPTGG